MDGCEIHEYTVYTTQGGGFYEKKDFFLESGDLMWPGPTIIAWMTNLG